MQRSKIVTITTDFGRQDAYVAAMKGRILSIAPDANIVEVTQEIEPGNIRQAAFVLSCAVAFFPEGSVHLAVVDPTVGSSRRGLAVSSRGQFFVGPDNGLFTPFLKGASIRELSEKKFFAEKISPTFHGRDIFALVAGHIASGVDIDTFGPEVEDPVVIEMPEPHIENKCIVGEVIHIDRFGNLITNINEETVRGFAAKEELTVSVEGEELRGLKRYYSEAPKGRLLALIGASGHLEIALAGGSAEKLLKAQIGTKVKVTLRAPP